MQERKRRRKKRGKEEVQVSHQDPDSAARAEVKVVKSRCTGRVSEILY